MTRAEVEKHLKGAVASHFADAQPRPCSDDQQLSLQATVHAWFESEGACDGLARETLLHYACVNHGYFTFDAQFTASSSFNYVDVSDPVSGLLRIPAPRSTEDFGFNWNQSSILVRTRGRKDDCRVDWLKTESNETVGTSIHVLT
jgi:hypothetical protein